MLARDIQTNKKVAAKKISFSGREKKPLFPTQVVSEINAMRVSNSNNIPKLFEIFQDDHAIILTMEYIKGIFFGGKKINSKRVNAEIFHQKSAGQEKDCILYLVESRADSLQY
jgi:serine/threonine protein kinase